MGIITSKINQKIDSIKSEYELNRNIVHSGIKGGLNESELSDLIKDIIPQCYTVSKGIIENYRGEQSSETDILIYDDEILPSYMKNDLSFVPVEAIKYAFEVKSTLNATEIKTTIEKFKRLKSIGGKFPRVLFAFSTDMKGSEISRYYQSESTIDFFTQPSISVISISDKCYYFKTVDEYYLKDHFTNKEWLQMVSKAMGMNTDGALTSFREMMSCEAMLAQMDRASFVQLMQGLIHMDTSISNIEDNEVTLNDVNYSDIKYKVHRWFGVERELSHIDNDIELSLLSGISNTLSKENFGKYLLNEKQLNVKEYAICFEDMWGNLSCKDFDETGLSYSTDEFSFSYKISEGNHKLTFYIEK